MLDAIKTKIRENKLYLVAVVSIATALIAWGGDEINFGQLIQAAYAAISGLF